MSIMTVEWKLEALDIAKKAISNHFKNLDKQGVDRIDGVIYQWNGYPQFLYELFMWAESKIRIQWDIDRLSIKLDVKPIRIKRLLKTYTIKELDTAYIKNWKIEIWEIIEVSKNIY